MDEMYAAGNVPYSAGMVPYSAGWNNIVGYDQIVGAAMQAAQAAAQGFPAAAPPSNQIAYGGQIGVSRSQSDKPRLYPLGFTQLAVAASAQVTVTSRPQILFRGQRLVVPSTVASNFILLDIRVGKDSQFVQSTQIPCQVFIETAVGVLMTLDTAQIANDISLVVQNTDGSNPHDFRAVVFGAAVDN